MELDERKKKILQTIIRNYLATGEPVGSRTISKDSELNLSSATIRNEMADLEELGLIIQPHTSAGRIPTDQAYRFYVDTMMENRVQELDTMQDVLLEKADKLDRLLQEVAKLLAVNTNYASLVSGPAFSQVKIKFIQLTPVDSRKLLMVLVLNGNLVKNKMISIEEEVPQDFVLKLNILLNTFLDGLSSPEISLGIMNHIKEQVGEYRELVNQVLDVIGTAVGEEEDPQVYTSGATNILKYPELQDTQKAAQLLHTFEEKNTLTKLISKDLKEEPENGTKGIQVYIGNENSVESMKDCSLVTATYEVEEGVYGKIGIVGPKRMDYEKVVGTLQTFMKQLDDIFKKEE